MDLQDFMRELLTQAQAQPDEATQANWREQVRVELTARADGWTMLLLCRVDRPPTGEELNEFLNALPYSLVGVPLVTPIVTQVSAKFYVATMWPSTQLVAR